jgi:hypothetical protein
MLFKNRGHNPYWKSQIERKKGYDEKGILDKAKGWKEIILHPVLNSLTLFLLCRWIINSEIKTFFENVS